MSGRPRLSIVIPVYNEAGNVPRIYRELKETARQSLADFELEILFMDNHSEDSSFEMISSLAEADPAVRAIRLSRNFGYQANILTGFRHCTGAAAVQLDCDGEDDPALIPLLVKKWQEGFSVVYGIRRKRHEGALLSLQRKFFYRLLRKISSVDIPVDAGDFRLIDRKVIDALGSFPEANPYLRGLISYAGFRSAGIPYDRRPRYSGAGKFSWWNYASLAIDGICSFSRAPLALAGWFGAGLILLGALGFGLGWPWMAALQTAIGGLQLLCIGIMGSYVGRISEQSARRPLSLVEKMIPGNEQARGR